MSVWRIQADSIVAVQRLTDEEALIEVAGNPDSCFNQDKPPLMPLDEQEFKTEADHALTSLYKKLSQASDGSDFEADFNSGALAIEFEEPPAKFVVSPNAPVRQIWVSAHSRSFKLDWDSARKEFVLRDNGESLTELIRKAIVQQLGEEVTL